MKQEVEDPTKSKWFYEPFSETNLRTQNCEQVEIEADMTHIRRNATVDIDGGKNF